MSKISAIALIALSALASSCGVPDRFTTKAVSTYTTEGRFVSPSIEMVTTWEKIEDDMWRRCSCGDWWLVPTSSVKIEIVGSGYKVTEYEGSIINIYQ